MVKKLLKFIPRKLINIVVSIEQVLDLKTAGFEDIVGRLKAYEERVKEADDGGEGSKVLFADGRSGNQNWRRKGKAMDSYGATVNKIHGFNGSNGSGYGGLSGSGGPKGNNRASQSGNRPNNTNSNKSINSNDANHKIKNK